MMDLNPLFDFFEVLCMLLLMSIFLFNLTVLTLWGLSGGIKTFFTFKKKKKGGHDAW